MAGSKDLIVEVPGLGKRLDTFIGKLAGDKTAVDQFVKDPVGMIRREVTPERTDLSPASISSGNRFVQKVLANDRFRQWAGGYQRQLLQRAQSGAPVEREQVLADIGAAMIDAGDPELLAAWSEHLVDAPPKAAGSLVVADEVAVVRIGVAVVVVVVTVIDFTPFAPNHKPAVSPGDVRSLGNAIVEAAKTLPK